MLRDQLPSVQAAKAAYHQSKPAQRTAPIAGADRLCNNGPVGHTHTGQIAYNRSPVPPTSRKSTCEGVAAPGGPSRSQPTITRECDNQLSPGNTMTTLKVTSLKVALPFKAGQLPITIDPDNPSFVIDLDGLRVLCKINSKAARKLRVHNETGGSAVLSGKLQVVNGELTLVEGGFQFLPPPDAADSATGMGGA